MVLDTVNNGGTVRTHYVGPNGDIHELSLPSGSPWEHFDLSVVGGGVGTAAGPLAIVLDTINNGGTVRTHYVGNGDIHELSLFGNGWHHYDLSQIGGGVNTAGGAVTSAAH
jgi:hypothetical protein